MARRSSARLRERNAINGTPQPPSSADDDFPRVPQTAPSKLGAVQESDEMPGAFPESPLSRRQISQTLNKETAPSTPKSATTIQPSSQDMHPQLHHQSTAKSFDEARHLGFSNLIPHTEPAKRNSHLATLQETPTKASKNTNGGNLSPQFKFTFRRERSLELSPEAKRMMEEKREEALRIRDQMVANGETKTSIADSMGRKWATPVSKKGRFSDAHAADFEKMPSIAGHASSFRTKPKTLMVATPSAQLKNMIERASARKRTHEDAGLSADHQTLDQTPTSAFDRQTRLFSFPSVPRTNPAALSQAPATPTAKRVKRAEDDETTTRHTNPSTSNRQTPTHHGTSGRPAMNASTKPAPISYTQTKLVRPTPKAGQFRTPVKSSVLSHIPTRKDQTTPLLARSPSKASIFPDISVPRVSSAVNSPLLSKSPLKSSPIKTSSLATISHANGTSQASSQLLLRSPVRNTHPRSPHQAQGSDGSSLYAKPLLSMTPKKPAGGAGDGSLATPLGKGNSAHDLNKAGLLLRVSPIKSILKSPQRLYSDDPVKVAAGTHLATPDKQAKTPSGGRVLLTARSTKHVDFSSSTKGQELSQESSNTAPSTAVIHNEPLLIEYPALPPLEEPSSPSPQKRRQTITPGDFTFRAGENAIVFGRSPSESSSPLKSPRASTIRHVSANSALPSVLPSAKKRKFEFENDEVTHIAMSEENKENKENAVDVRDKTLDERPTKRLRPDVANSKPIKTPTKPAPQPLGSRPSRVVSSALPVKRNPTLGVKPKGSKTLPNKDHKARRANTISQSRLAELSKPKQR